MKLARFDSRTGDGPGWGMVDKQAGVVVEAPHGQWVRSGEQMVQALVRMGPIALRERFDDAKLLRRPIGLLQLLPPVASPNRILCVGLNYRAHVEEVGRELPAHPSVFLRAADTLVGHNEEVPRPAVSECLDFEGELALVIGTGGSRIEARQAMSHVAGYTCFNDISVRDWQKHSVTAGKNFERTGPCGPWLSTADGIEEPNLLEVVTRLNGREVQRARVGTMVYSLATLVAYLSTIAPLRCGDIIATGTPAGVGSGRKPPLWMQPGDCVEVEIPGIGTLANTIVQGI